MKICRRCHSEFFSLDWRCPACGWEPERLSHNVFSLASNAIEPNEGFNPAYFEELAKLEQDNFWFRARNTLIVKVLAKHFPAMSSILEVGCGTGNVLRAIGATFPSARLVGSEIFRTGLGFAANRLPDVELLQMDARSVPYINEFDVVGAFDVIEHIHEDQAVLGQMSRACSSNGGVLLTVPQHSWFWSYQDELACHVRRYSATELIQKVEAAGFEVIDAISFVTLLFPVMWLSRRVPRVGSSHKNDAIADMRISSLLNSIFGLVMAIELLFIQAGVRFRFGGSLLIIGKKCKSAS